MDPSTLKTIATRLAPQVHFHSKEQFFPCSVEWYLGCAGYTPDRKKATLYKKELPVRTEDIVAKLKEIGKTGNVDHYSLVVDEDASDKVGSLEFNTWEGMPLKNNECVAPCYYRVFGSETFYFVTYYFFYAYNGGMGPTAKWQLDPKIDYLAPAWGFYAHEADWEEVSVAFCPTSDQSKIRIKAVGMEVHGTMCWDFDAYGKEDTPISSLAHLEVYSAWHSHSSRPAPGEYPLDNPGVDYCDAGGKVWKTWEGEDRLIELTDTSPAWVPYTGWWGSQREHTFMNLPVMVGGPDGPCTKSTWNIDRMDDIFPLYIKDYPMLCVHRGGNSSNLWWFGGNGGAKGGWGSDNGFTGGNTCRSEPALASYNGKIICAHRGAGSNDMFFAFLNEKDGSWQPDIGFPAHRTSAGPGLATHDGKLFCVHKGGEDTAMWWCTFNADTGNWNPDRAFPDHGTLNTPALCIAKGLNNIVVDGKAIDRPSLICVHRGGSGDKLWWCRFNDDLQNWDPDKAFPENEHTTTTAPALAVFRDTVYCVFVVGNQLRWCTLDPTTESKWTAPERIAGNTTFFTPALGVCGDRLYCVYKGAESKDMFWCSLDPHTEVWSSGLGIPDRATQGGIAMLSLQR